MIFNILVRKFLTHEVFLVDKCKNIFSISEELFTIEVLNISYRNIILLKFYIKCFGNYQFQNRIIQ